MSDYSKNTIANTGTKVLERPRLASLLLVFSGILALAYIYLVSTAVFDIVARKNAEAEARTLRSRVGALELHYLALDHAIDLDYARTLGFVEDRTTSFASRTASTASLSGINGPDNEI